MNQRGTMFGSCIVASKELKTFFQKVDKMQMSRRHSETQFIVVVCISLSLSLSLSLCVCLSVSLCLSLSVSLSLCLSVFCLVDLVVKASASRAEDPEFKSHLDWKRPHTLNLTQNSEPQRYSWRTQKKNKIEKFASSVQHVSFCHSRQPDGWTYNGWPSGPIRPASQTDMTDYKDWSVTHNDLLLLRSAAISLGLTILGGNFAYLLFFQKNPTIEVVIFNLRGWCMLGVCLLLAFTHLEHERQDLLSPCDGMRVCTD